MDVILAYDGDVIKFAGDSLIVAFYPSASEQQGSDAGLLVATMRAVRCGADLAASFGASLN